MTTATPHASPDAALDRPTLAFVAVGIASVVVGGLVAAVTRPLQWEYGSWLAAYLVLVSGVAQVVLGAAPGALRLRPPSATTRWVGFACWNLGNALVVAGTLLPAAALVFVGSVPLVVTLVLAGLASAGAPDAGDRAQAFGRGAYRVLLVVVLVSIPVGGLLATLRQS